MLQPQITSVARSSGRSSLRSIYLALSAAAAWLAATPAIAETITVTSAIDSVTVYPRGAQVTRTAEVAVPQGSHTLRITNLPDEVLPETVRVTGTSDGTLEIGAVDLKRVELTREEAERDAAARRDLEDRIRSLETELEKTGYEVRVKETQRDFLTNLAGLPNRGGAPGEGQAAPTDWAAVFELIGTSMARVQSDLFALRQQLLETERRIEDVRRELARLAPKPADRLVGDVSVTAAGAQSANLQVRYQVRSASWFPLYDARLETGSETTPASLQLTRRAAIQQNSGEAWDNIELILSTVRPSARTAAPEVGSLFVEFEQPPVAAALESERRFAAEDAMADRRERDEAERGGQLRSVRPTARVAAAPARPKLVVEQEAAVETGRFQATFAVPERVTVANDGTLKQVRIAAETVEPKLVVRTAPQFVPQAFLYAVYELPGAAPYLPGTMTLFRDGTYVGRGRMTELAGGEEHELGFGADDRVKVTFAVADDTRANQSGIISSSRTETKSFKMTVKNLHDRRVEVFVTDRMPVSREKDIAVEITASPKASETDVEDRRGVLAWGFGLDPGTEQVITTRYKLTWPADKAIVYR